MYDGTIVKFAGELYKRIMGKWVLYVEDTSVRYSDEWMNAQDFEVVAKAGPLADVAEGTVVASACSSIVAVYQGLGEWTISGYGDWFSTDEMLEYLGTGWKVIYKAGENDE